MGRSGIWPEQSEEPRAVGDAPVWGSHTSRGSHDFSLFSAGDVGVSHEISQGKCQELHLLPGEVLLSCRRTHHFLNKPHGSAAIQSQALLCVGRERCAAQGHTSVTRPNAHSHHISHMQISSVCINCEVGLLSLQLSPLWSTCTRRQFQHVLPSLLSSHSPPCSSHNSQTLTAEMIW